MQIRLEFNENINQSVYKSFSKYILKEVKRSIRKLADPRKYKVRESLVIDSPLIKWNRKPNSIDLLQYINECLVLRYIKGCFVITLDDHKRIRRSRTKLSKLIRMLEYGTDSIPAYPLIRSVMQYYQENYSLMVMNYVKGSLYERLSLRRSTR